MATATATRRTTTTGARRRATAKEQRDTHTLDQYAAAIGRSLRMVGDVRCAVELRTDPDGAEQVVQAVFALPGEYAAFGLVQTAAVDASRWMVSDGRGWLEPEFPTLEAGVAAVLNTQTRRAMRERTDRIERLYALERELREQTIDGALPSAAGRSRGWI